MLESFTLWEALLAAAAFLLAGNEVVGLLHARRQGLTRNVSRLLTHSLLMVLLLAYLGYGTYLHTLMTSPDFPTRRDRLPAFSWPYLLVGLMLVVLISYELVAMYRARRVGLTRNVSRLITRSVILLLLLVMMGISQQKWELYLERLQSLYQDSVRPAGD